MHRISLPPSRSLCFSLAAPYRIRRGSRAFPPADRRDKCNLAARNYELINGGRSAFHGAPRREPRDFTLVHVG